MAKKMNDYQIIKCPHCFSEYYDSDAHDGDEVGNPKTECPACGKVSYRSSILEPAIIGGNRFFEVKFSSLYKKLRIGMVFFYIVFIVVAIVMRDMYVATGMLAAAMIMYVFYEIIRIVHRKTYLKSEEYEMEVKHSLERFEDENYARLMIRTQGIDVESIYYRELYREEDL